jgi:SAM-dependent methyltransferase
MATYGTDFFRSIEAGSLRSARAVVPLILDLLQPASVIDVGCGLGAWLAVFREKGIEDVLGVDGEYVDTVQLGIPRDRFLVHDLSAPLTMSRSFDMVLSLEVAEHLPEESAGVFIGSLVNLAPVVVFSAAIPHQGGTHHVNERWPEYWTGLFAARGYEVIDCLRWEIWNDADVEWWYRQNMLVFGARDFVARHPVLREELEATDPDQLSVVHPGCFLHHMGG